MFGACLQVVLAIVLALTLYECREIERLRRTLILILLVLPMMLPPSIVGVLWRFLLTPSNGAVNNALLKLGLISEHIEWFNAGMSLWSIIIADIWNWTALPLLIIYSGRVSLPPAVYEAARVDGASQWMVLRRITLPMLKEVIAIALHPALHRRLQVRRSRLRDDLRRTRAILRAAVLYRLSARHPRVRGRRGGRLCHHHLRHRRRLVTLFLKYMKRVMKAQGIA